MKKKKIGFISRVYPRFAVFVAGMSLGACAIVIILGYLAIAADIVSMSGDKNAFFYIITLLFASSLIAITATCTYGPVLTVGHGLSKSWLTLMTERMVSYSGFKVGR